MPNATVNPNHFEREELTSLDEAYIMVRPLPYGMKLQRRDKATRMYMEANPGKKKKDAENEVQRFELETMNEWATLFDFSYCIGEHNLEDAKGALLDFTSPMTLKILDPKVGSELERILGKYNEEDSEEELEDFIKRHTSPTPIEPTGSQDQ